MSEVGADEVLVVGSVALDTVETPAGRAEDVLGGAATYFALAARLFAPVRLVGVVGSDFPDEHLELLRGAGLDISGIERAPGPSFRWSGRYHDDLESRETLDLQLNVFAGWRPQLRDQDRAASHLFLATIDPDLQLAVLQECSPRHCACDTIAHWISEKRPQIERLFRSVDTVVINEEEARLYARTRSLPAAAAQILGLGPQPRAVVIKKGEHGAVLHGEGGWFNSPAYPLEVVTDPTGAGDSFAGAMMGYLARRGRADEATLRQAVVLGGVVASFTVEAFGPERLARLTWEEVAGRYEATRRMTAFEDVVMTREV